MAHATPTVRVPAAAAPQTVAREYVTSHRPQSRDPMRKIGEMAHRVRDLARDLAGLKPPHYAQIVRFKLSYLPPLPAKTKPSMP